jgi:hypothetical protein
VFSVSETPNVSQHPMRGLTAGQDGISEPGDEGAVLRLISRRTAITSGIGSSSTSLLRKVWLATPALEEVMRTGLSDRTNAAEAARFVYPRIPANERPSGVTRER